MLEGWEEVSRPLLCSCRWLLSEDESLTGLGLFEADIATDLGGGRWQRRIRGRYPADLGGGRWVRKRRIWRSGVDNDGFHQKLRPTWCRQHLAIACPRRYRLFIIQFVSLQRAAAGSTTPVALCYKRKICRSTEIRCFY